MSDFTSGFWNLYVIVLTTLSIIACGVLLVSMSKTPKGAPAKAGTKALRTFSRM